MNDRITISTDRTGRVIARADWRRDDYTKGVMNHCMPKGTSFEDAMRIGAEKLSQLESPVQPISFARYESRASRELRRELDREFAREERRFSRDCESSITFAERMLLAK